MVVLGFNNDFVFVVIQFFDQQVQIAIVDEDVTANGYVIDEVFVGNGESVRVP